MASTSTAAADKGKRPMFPEDDPAAAAAAEAKPSALSDPKAGGDAKEKKPAADGGDDGDLVLVTECGTELRLSLPAARMSTMLGGMVEDGCAEGRIRVPGIRAGILRMVAAYCEKHGPYYDHATAGRDRDPFPPFPIEFPSGSLAIDHGTVPNPDPHGLKSWDQEFITAGIDNSTLFEIILAANFLGIEDLVELGCSAVADKMRGKTPEQIREAFDIENDYTAEEEAEVFKGVLEGMDEMLNDEDKGIVEKMAMNLAADMANNDDAP